MAKYLDPTTQTVSEISSPELNPSLIAGKTLVADTAPTGGVMSLSTLNSNPTPTQFVNPNPDPIYPVAGLNSDPMQLTAPEQKANDLTTQLQDLNNSLVGESAYRQEQQAAQGIPELQKTQTDLTARLNSLKNEALAIPLNIEQAYTGRGATVGGVAPIQATALRENAIKSLSVSSLLEASRGNLSTALDLADRAVAQKFAPIKAEIAAKTANLDLILKSPEYTLADKKRAQAQLDKKNAEAKALAIQEDNTKSIQALALQALQNGAPAPIVSKIMSSPDLVSAYTNAVGYAQKETAQSIQEYNFAVRNGYTGSFTQYQNEDANRKVAIAKAGVATGSGPVTQVQLTNANYATRLQQAAPIIDRLSSQFTGADSIVGNSKLFPEILKSEDRKSLEQAERNFINAVLRRESGAVISQEEFDNAAKQYFPQPGDTRKILEQKKANRDLVIQNFLQSSNLPSGSSSSNITDLRTKYNY